MSDTTSATDTTTDTADTTDVTATDTTDWKAEAERYRAQSRKQEERAKLNSAAAKELETLKLQSMSDLEKAVATAKAEARTEALRETSIRVVASEIRAAAAGRSIDVAALLEHVDASKFVTEDGEPDTKEIGKWLDRIAPIPEPSDGVRRVVDLGQGTRGLAQRVDSDPAAQFGRFLQDQLNKS